MKDSRKTRKLAATFIVGGAGVVVLEYFIRPGIEKGLKTKVRGR